MKKNYKEMIKSIIDKSEKPKVNEGMVYPDGLNERMHPQLEQELKDRKHSLGKHPVFPEDDETNFEEKIMGERFKEVVSRYKRAFDCDNIENREVMSGLMPLVHETMSLESKHKKDLIDLAIRMVREEYDMDEDVVEIHAELTPNVNLIGTKKEPTPAASDMEFNNHDEMINLKKEVYKRRFLNAMTQGAAKKCNHMFHLVDDEITDIEPKLMSKYSKMMAAADYMYYIVPKMEGAGSVSGGVVKVQFPSKTNPKAKIYVQAMVFPVLVHELVKGVMELLSAHGLPKDRKNGEYVIGKADFLAAEPWDMRLGPALWAKFTDAIDSDDFNLKHHIYSELASLPVDEFNISMREILSGTKDGKQIIKDIVTEVKAGLQGEEFDAAMSEVETSSDEADSEGFDFEDLFGSSDDSDSEEGFDFEDLF